jgi:hypothetical protein
MTQLVAKTDVWWMERLFAKGAEFTVVAVPDEGATDPVQVDRGTADRWLRQKRAETVEKRAAADRPRKSGK